LRNRVLSLTLIRNYFCLMSPVPSIHVSVPISEKIKMESIPSIQKYLIYGKVAMLCSYKASFHQTTGCYFWSFGQVRNSQKRGLRWDTCHCGEHVMFPKFCSQLIKVILYLFILFLALLSIELRTFFLPLEPCCHPQSFCFSLFFR
jgi:hypothetical protein